MDTTRTRAALRMFPRSRSPVAVRASAALVATLFGISGVSVSMTLGVASTTASGEKVIGDPRLVLTPALDTSEPYLPALP
jgi:hypothetical protein